MQRCLKGCHYFSEIKRAADHEERMCGSGSVGVPLTMDLTLTVAPVPKTLGPVPSMSVQADCAKQAFIVAVTSSDAETSTETGVSRMPTPIALPSHRQLKAHHMMEESP